MMIKKKEETGKTNKQSSNQNRNQKQVGREEEEKKNKKRKRKRNSWYINEVQYNMKDCFL